MRSGQQPEEQIPLFGAADAARPAPAAPAGDARRATPRVSLPRELILASAGSGKTYHISSRIIGLLAHGAPTESVFASTFTRKAAGEILERVLQRLARATQDAAEARELAGAAAFAAAPGARPQPLPAEPDFWAGVLERVVGDLHRLSISTLDAFFVRAARSFSLDLGMPPGWRIADEPAAGRVRADALRDVLRETDTGALIELVRGMTGDRIGRSVHDALLQRADELLLVHHAMEEGTNAWEALSSLDADPDAVTPQARETLARRFQDADLPTTQKGLPNTNYVKAMRKAGELVRDGRWEELVKETLCAACMDGGSGLYGRAPVPDPIVGLFRDACTHAWHALAARYAAQAAAMGRFTRLYADALAARLRASGDYRFDDITRVLGGSDPLGAREDLFYRLDARLQHILLDEFQDTSLAQYEALEPVVGELLSGYEGERAAVIVADPKQSIYGWRGASPLLVHRIGDRYGLERGTRAESWRSSRVVLDAVNRIFEPLETLPIWSDDDVARDTAAAWKQDFATHVARRELPGFVCVRVGPPDDGRSQARPRLCAAAAALVQALHQQSPGASIGVLTRTNRTVARVMFELQRRGVHASEEGGNPLTDAAPVAAVLALLRMADHPADTIARYHVAGTPLGVALGFTDHLDDRAARELARSIRRRLVEDGEGATVAWLAGLVAHACDAREQRRMAQLVELAFRAEQATTLRATDFVRLVEETRVEDPSAADVRVMTVHQAKGLEFDIVVLPELDAHLSKNGSGPLAFRPDPAGRATMVFPRIPKDVQPLFRDRVPEIEAAAAQEQSAALRDALSSLYVALTRARHELHIIVKPDGEKGPGTAKTAARVIREALAPGSEATEGAILFESGSPGAAAAHIREQQELARQEQHPPAGDAGPATAAAEDEAAGAPSRVRLRKPESRQRVLPRRSPSELEGGDAIELASILRLEAAATAERGTIAHAWFETIGWIEDGVPHDEALRAVAAAVAPNVPPEKVEEYLGEFRRWLAGDTVRAQLSRAAFPAGATVEQEVRFLRREEGFIMEGIIDRLVLLRDGGRVTGAIVIDWKTDAVEAGDEATIAQRVAFYRPQIEAYRRTASAMYQLPEASVSGRLVIAGAEAVVEV
jgi:ATP-dependent helicase/nuclease subunit A